MISRNMLGAACVFKVDIDIRNTDLTQTLLKD